MDDKKLHAEVERHMGKVKDCSRECTEIKNIAWKLKIVSWILGLTLTFGAIFGLWAYGKIEKTEATDAALSKRLDVHRTDINRQDDRMDELIRREAGAKRK